MGRKNREINIIKNPQDRDVTFISDPVRETIQQQQQQHTNQQENDSSGNNYDDDKKKLVKKARHNPNRSSKHNYSEQVEPRFIQAKSFTSLQITDVLVGIDFEDGQDRRE